MILKNLPFMALLLTTASAIVLPQAAYPQGTPSPVESPAVPPSAAVPQDAGEHSVAVTNFRFGTMRQVSANAFVFVRETTVLPKMLKSTGFRFCLMFDNPQREKIEWYEIMRFPADVKDVSGQFFQADPQTLRTEPSISDEASITDTFWFDEGDPLGAYTLELYINGTLRHTVHFEVVPVVDI